MAFVIAVILFENAEVSADEHDGHGEDPFYWGEQSRQHYRHLPLSKYPLPYFIFSKVYSSRANSFPYTIGLGDHPGQIHALIQQGVPLPTESMWYHVSCAHPQR